MFPAQSAVFSFGVEVAWYKMIIWKKNANRFPLHNTIQQSEIISQKRTPILNFLAFSQESFSKLLLLTVLLEWSCKINILWRHRFMELRMLIQEMISTHCAVFSFLLFGKCVPVQNVRNFQVLSEYCEVYFIYTKWNMIQYWNKKAFSSWKWWKFAFW